MSVLSLTIAAQVAEYWRRERELEQASPPSEAERRAAEATAAERARLRAGGVPAGVIAPGTTLRDTPLLDPFGAETSLYETIPGGRPAVIVFYRGAWCPFCNIALHTYQEVLLPELQRRDVALMAVSPQKPDGSMTMIQKHQLTFAVLSDPGLKLAEQAGIVMRLSDLTRQAVIDAGLNFAARNADGQPTLPMPTVLIIDGQRVVRWVKVNPDWTERSEPAEIVAALDALGLTVGVPG
ncbi:MAG: peroxiredoxin-like family protein [Solirubrobacteraceae bacterium]|jgi:peroxiredoxin